MAHIFENFIEIVTFPATERPDDPRRICRQGTMRTFLLEMR